MATFPPRAWTVRFLQDMENIDCGLIDGNNLTMEALVAVRPAGGEEGNFRFALAGPDMLKLVFPVSRILAGAAFSNMIAEVEMKPGDQIRLEKNSISTTWWDFEDLRMSSSPTGKAKTWGTSFSRLSGTTRRSRLRRPTGRACACRGSWGPARGARMSSSWHR